MRLSLFDRYIATAMLKATALTLLVLVILLVFFGLIEETDEVGDGAYTLADAFLVAVLAAPRYIFEVFPVGVLIGSLIGLGAMATHGELTAMRSAGYSLRQIVFAVMKSGLLMMVLVFLFGEFVAPASEQWANQHRMEKLQEKVTFSTRNGFWARDGQAFVNIREILPGARLEDIHVYEFDDVRSLKLATHAQRAEHRGDHWLMFDITQSRVSTAGVSQRQLAQARWDSLLDPGLLSAIIVRPSVLPVVELYRYIQVMRRNGQSATDYEVAFWGKLSIPLATVVMLFIAIPFVLVNQRFVSMGQRIFLGVLLGMGFYLLNRGMSYVAVVYEFNPVISALVPAAAFLAIALYMFRGVR